MPSMTLGFRFVFVLIASLLLRVAPAMALPMSAVPVVPSAVAVAAAEAPCHEQESVTSGIRMDHAAHTPTSDTQHHGACQIACDLGAAPALSTPLLTLGTAPAPVWVARIPALHGVAPLPPEPPPPNRG